MIWPGLAVDATADGEAASVDAGVDAAAVDGGAVAGVEPPHAPAAMATTETRAANRVRLVLRIWLLLSLCERNPVPGTLGHGARSAALRSLSRFLSAALHSIA
jgi:hypothetical protein